MGGLRRKLCGGFLGQDTNDNKIIYNTLEESHSENIRIKIGSDAYAARADQFGEPGAGTR